jgi:hypothetical protein
MPVIQAVDHTMQLLTTKDVLKLGRSYSGTAKQQCRAVVALPMLFMQ